MPETMSSFGSTSFSPSMANLLPIQVHVKEGGGGRVRVYDPKVGIGEQFSHMSMGQAGQKQEEGGFTVHSLLPLMPITIVTFVMPNVMPMNYALSEYQGSVVFDNEQSDHGVLIEYRKRSEPFSSSEMFSFISYPFDSIVIYVSVYKCCLQ